MTVDDKKTVSPGRQSLYIYICIIRTYRQYIFGDDDGTYIAKKKKEKNACIHNTYKTMEISHSENVAPDRRLYNKIEEQKKVFFINIVSFFLHLLCISREPNSIVIHKSNRLVTILNVRKQCDTRLL